MTHRSGGRFIAGPRSTPLNRRSSKEQVVKVKFRVGVSHEGKRYNSGETADVPEDVAKLWVGLGFAEPANADKQRQKAVRRAPRTATKQAAPAASSKAKRTGTAKK